jgi:hypothetical protein
MLHSIPWSLASARVRASAYWTPRSECQSSPMVFGLPYDFSQPLPYKGLDEELTDSPPAIPAEVH